MSMNFDRGSPGKFDSWTLNRETLNRWTGRRGFDYNFTNYNFKTNTCVNIEKCLISNHMKNLRGWLETRLAKKYLR